MIHFECEHCGTRLRVLETQTGKESHCPKCKGQIAIPGIPASEPLAEPPSTPAVEKTAAKLLDQQFLDLPKPLPTDKLSPEERMRELEVRARLGLMPPPEHTGERQFPWPIDILLYATNAAGLTALTVLVGIPVLLHLVEFLLRAPFPFLLPIRIIFGLYGAWYFVECVQDSARGGTRAPEPFGATAGLGEIRSRISNLVAVYLTFIGPACFYYLFAQRTDAIFWVLAAWAVIFFPIGLLAVIIEESLSALNPRFLLRSILHVLRPYLGLLMLILAPVALAWLLSRGSREKEPSIWLLTVGQLMGGYATFLMAHILGRFYWRHADRLDWDF